MKCKNPGCNKEAGTKWSPYWCEEHDTERRKRITGLLEKMLEDFDDKGGE